MRELGRGQRVGSRRAAPRAHRAGARRAEHHHALPWATARPASVRRTRRSSFSRASRWSHGPFGLRRAVVRQARDALHALEHPGRKHRAQHQRGRRKVVLRDVPAQLHLERRKERSVGTNPRDDRLDLTLGQLKSRCQNDAQRASPSVVDEHGLAGLHDAQRVGHGVGERLSAAWPGSINGHLHREHRDRVSRRGRRTLHAARASHRPCRPRSGACPRACRRQGRIPACRFRRSGRG